MTRPVELVKKTRGIGQCKVGMIGQKSKTAKKAEALHRNLNAMIEKHGLKNIVLCTLTFAHDPQTTKEAQRRLNNLARRVLSEIFTDYVVAVHRGTQRGRLHYHLIAATKSDVRTGFDFEAWNRLLAHVHLFGRKNARYYELSKAVSCSANPALSAIWKLFREKAKSYGFGMVETYPIRSNAEAIGRYVGSYVRVGAENRQLRDKGSRTIRYHVEGAYWRIRDIIWPSGPALDWRNGEAALSLLMGFDKRADLRATFGKRWAWELKREIMLLGRWVSKASDKFYLVAEGFTKLPLSERWAQTGEFCRQLERHERMTTS